MFFVGDLDPLLQRNPEREFNKLFLSLGFREKGDLA